MSSKDVLEGALAHAAAGRPVFPCKNKPGADDDKEPYTRHGFHDASTDEHQIRQWWRQFPNALIGMPTGKASGIDVLDLDNKNGKCGFDFLPDWETRSPVIVRTRTAGAHLYYKAAGVTCSTDALALGVDVRGVGGYVIVVPSAGYTYHNGVADLSKLEPFPDEFRPPKKKKKTAAPPQGDHATLAAAMAVIPNTDLSWAEWNNVGLALWAAAGPSGFAIFDAWSAKYDGYDADNTLERWEAYATSPPNRTGAGKIFAMADAIDPGWRGVSVRDFHAYMPTHQYIYGPTGEMWAASSVNSRCPKTNDVKAADWLDRNAPVETMTWAPGRPRVVKDELFTHDGWLKRHGVATYNLYLPPTIEHGVPTMAGQWLELVKKVYPDDAAHIVQCFAHRVQKPAEKINHAVVLGGQPGIGKDTIIEPLTYAVGLSNFREASPAAIMGQFNPFVKSVVLRVSEAQDLGDVNRYTFYERTKALTASPPSILACNEKHLREYNVANACFVIITTNHKTDGLYLPADDRRHYVAWSELGPCPFTSDYWDSLWRWYFAGGFGHVAAYLAGLDLSYFDAKAPPKKTDAFWEIVNASHSTAEGDLEDVLDRIGRDAVTIGMVRDAADSALREVLDDNTKGRRIPALLEAAGWLLVTNPYDKRGRWLVAGRQTKVYARRDLSPRQRRDAAEALCANPPKGIRE